VKVDVVSIGTELLLGFTLDTNIGDISRALADVGLAVDRHQSVADRPHAIRDAVASALDHADVVITTGGLGPTRDDMTKQVVAELFGLRLRHDPVVFAQLEERFRRLGRAMPASNRSQADVPDGATVLPNPRGTAPGLWIENAAGRIAVLLPGVPHEMRGLMREQVVPRLKARAGEDGGRVVRSRMLRTTGVAESAIAERVRGAEEAIAPLTLAYLPGPPGVDLRVTAWGLEPADAERRLAAAVAHLTPLVGLDCYGADDTDLAAVVLDKLRASGMRVSVAESCTGGLIGGRLTAISGASDTFVGGVIAYDNAVKAELLGVPASLIEEHGAVSEPVVRAMAEGAARVFGTGAAMAVTGIAGPGGGTPAKPVGTVWMAARVGDTVRTLRRVMPGDREEIRERAAQAVLDLLRRLLEPG
jgi:nicotinamide-nucleotide amidase